MTDPALLSALCQKLGHGLEEVRVRALETLVSKLDRGFIKITDLIRSKDFLVKLLEWFGVQPCFAQERVLGLILGILQEEGSERVVVQIGAQRVLLALNTIRESLPSQLCPLLDDIVGLVHRAQTIQGQRDDDVDSITSGDGVATEGTGPRTQSGTDSDGFLIDASLQEALEEALQDNPVTQDSTEPIFNLRSNDMQLEGAIFNNALKQIVLPWQPLISTDRHVLIAVENSLANTADRTQLLNTCSFLTDVMMRDFPAEVFLQRPAILMTFMKLMKSSFLVDDRLLAKMIITCLLTLTNALQSRLRHYRDPNMVNQKQESFLRHDEVASQVSSGSVISNGDDQMNTESQCRIIGWNDHQGKQPNSHSSSQGTFQSQSFPPTLDDAERSHYSGTQASSDSTETSEPSLVRLRQCSLPQFCLLAMRHTLPHVDTQPDSCLLLYKLSHLLSECVTSQIWLAPTTDIVSTDICTHLHKVLEIFGGILQQDRSDTPSRLVYLQLLAVIRHFLLRLVPLELADSFLPRTIKTALCSSLLDGSLHAFFPTLHSDLLQYAQMFKNLRDIDSLKLFESTLSVAESLSCAAKLLTQSDLSDGSNFVLKAESALSSLSYHQDFSFLPLVLDCCSKYYHSWHLTESELNTLSSIILKLLAHADLNVRKKAYSHLHKQVLENLGVQHSQRPPAESLAFLLFNTSLLLEITTHGIPNKEDLIQNCAEDIMLHILKGRFLLGSTYWMQFLSFLGPVLPLLQCWADKPSALGRAITTMLNPDVGSQMQLETSELLKGNLRLQFSKDEFVRREALSRLIWLLTKEEDAFTKLPHIATLHNCANDNMCLVEKQIDVFRNIPEKSFYQESSLLQVLEIVQSSGLEPRMLLSVLTQVAAILEDPRHHEIFLSKGGLTVSIEYLHASMSDKRVDVYPEVIAPVISILRSLCLHNSVTRHQLSKNVQVFYSVLRGLVMFPSDTCLRSNASQLLAVLLYNDVIISASPHTLSDGFVVRGISMPHLILSRMCLPVSCSTHWRTSHFTEPLMTDVLLRHEECRVFLATAWNLSFFKSEYSPLLWAPGSILPKPVSIAQEKFSVSLKLSNRDLIILQSSAMLNLCQKQLINIQEASTHSDVTKALDIMQRILTLYSMLNEKHLKMRDKLSDTQHFQECYKTLPWRQTFRRFLVSAPASIEDQQLLIHVLQFLRVHVKVSCSLGFQSKDGRWLSKLLQHPSQPLVNLFHTVAHTGYAGDSDMPKELSHLPKWKQLCKELLSVITECACFEQYQLSQKNQIFQSDHEDNKENCDDANKRTRNISKAVSCLDGNESKQTELERADRWVGEVVSMHNKDAKSTNCATWTHVIHNVVSCLKSSDTQHFYNLAYLDWLLWALTHLTANSGWSIGLKGAQLRAHFSEILNVLLELVQAFHLECGKGGSSYMGLSITRASILCLNHLLEEMQQYKELKWEDLWYIATRKASRSEIYVPWLSSLFQSRESIVRAAALRLAAGIAITPHGFNQIMNMLSDHSDVWMAPLCILLDHVEASIVREEAANLLSNLLRNRTGESGSGDNESRNASFEVLRHRMLECGFLSELLYIVDCLSLATYWDPNRCISGDIGLALENQAEKNSFSPLSSDQYILIHSNNGSVMDSNEDRTASVPCTPSFMRGLCNFIDAVMNLSYDALATFAKESVCGQLLRCLNSIPSFNSQNVRAMQLYHDVLKMYAGICHVVSKCITSNPLSCQYILQQPQTVHKLLSLLDPTLFCIDAPAMLKLRNELWTEVLWLISALIGMHGSDETNREENGHSVLHSLLIRSRGEPLVSVLTVSLSGSLLTELQQAALACVQSLLFHPASAVGQPFAVLLDDIDADFNSSNVAAKEANVDDSIGSSLCRSLLALYDVHSLQIGSADDASTDWRSQRIAVAGALAAVLDVSTSAKSVALHQNFVELICAQLGAVQSYLILEPGETMKRLASKKKICPVLQDLDLLLGLLNCMSLQNNEAKQLATDIGVTDTIHKLWTWCLSQPSLLLSVLRLLATLTSGCPSAAHSLVLTTTVPGLGLRRTPSSQSLLHALVALVLYETEQSISCDDFTVLSIACDVLSNACHVPECRTALTKSNLLLGIRHLHSNLSKKSKRKKHVETLWLALLVQLSAFQEGQIVLPKIPDLLDYLKNLAYGQKRNNKLALQVLRNIAFCSMNRPRLLASGEFLLLINKKLRDGDTEEQVSAAAALWALTANNQKGKLAAKCSGTDSYLLDSLRQLAVSQKPGGDFVAPLLNCVLRVLRHEPSHVVSQAQ